MSNFERKKTTSCIGCMKALKWIPVLFISSVIVWSYYAYVVQLCILSIENTFEKIIFLIFYHIICILFFWSYWNTIFTPVGVIPSQWRIQDVDLDRLFHADSQEQQKRILENCSKSLPITNRTVSGSVRFCEKCKIIKPDRAHHCSVCGSCVLKMDHHCPWVNNCVNFYNYKFFVLFLGYALLYCLYVALTSLEYFIRFWKGDLNDGMGRFHILFLFFISLMFAISLVSLFGYHIYLVLMNRTTLESFRAPIFRIGGPDKNGFNLGKYNNFQEVFGDNWKLWLVPVYTSLGNGMEYKTSPQQQQRSQQEYNMRQYQNRTSPPLPTMYNQQPQPANYDSMGATQNRLDLIEQTDQLITPNDQQQDQQPDQQQQQQQQQFPSLSSALSKSQQQQKSDTNVITPISINSAKFSEISKNNAQKSNHNNQVTIDMLEKNTLDDAAAAAVAAVNGSPSKLGSVNANANIIIDMTSATKSKWNDKKTDAYT